LIDVGRVKGRDYATFQSPFLKRSNLAL